MDETLALKVLIFMHRQRDPPWGPTVEFLRRELNTKRLSWSEKLEGDNKCGDENEAASGS